MRNDGLIRAVIKSGVTAYNATVPPTGSCGGFVLGRDSEGGALHLTEALALTPFAL